MKIARIKAFLCLFLAQSPLAISFVAAWKHDLEFTIAGIVVTIVVDLIYAFLL